MRRGWSINPSDWSGLSKALTASPTWNSVLLTPNDRHMVPESPGIYAICAHPPIVLKTTERTMFQSLATPIYVGRSESSIRDRFLDHCNTRDERMKLAKKCYSSVRLHFWFIQLPQASVRNMEGRLIDCFGPSVNRRRGTIAGTVGQPIDA